MINEITWYAISFYIGGFWFHLSKDGLYWRDQHGNRWYLHCDEIVSEGCVDRIKLKTIKQQYATNS